MTSKFSYFTNSIRCCDIHHGASCAVDALLEMYFYSIYKFDHTVLNIDESPLLHELNSTCMMRDSLNVVSCEMRDGVWDWLVENVPHAYAAKGRHDAEFIAGLKVMASHCGRKFQSSLNGTFFCPKCELPFQSDETSDIISLHSVRINGDGSLHECIVEEYKKRIYSHAKSCSNCKGRLDIQDVGVTLPKFLLVELGMVNFKNPQNPPFQICEDFVLCGIEYELTGAVVMRPDHFYNIIKLGQQYAQVDGYPSLDDVHLYPKMFSSFSGAVKNDETEVSLSHSTNPENAVGIHVLVYHCKDCDYAHDRISLNTVITTQDRDLSATPNKPTSVASDIEQVITITNTPPDKECDPLSNMKPKQKPVDMFTPKSEVRKENYQYANRTAVHKLKNGVHNIAIKSDHIVLNKCNVRIRNLQNFAYLSCKDIFQALNMSSHISKEGYSWVDKRLRNLGYNVQAVYIKEGARRKFIRLDAIYDLICEKGGKNKVWKEAQLKVKKDLVEILNTKVMGCSDSDDKESTNHPWRHGRTPQKQRHKVLQTRMRECLESTYRGNKELFCNGISKLIHAEGQKHCMFDKQEMVDILQRVPPTKNAERGSQNLLQEISRENSQTRLSVIDLINLEEHFSGTRLGDELRKLLPGVIPTKKEENDQRCEYRREFLATLKPQRTETGWRVDPHKLLDILCFRYYWIEGPTHWKIYGDGREIGGRQSTFLAISLLNDEAALHGISYHDPREVFPMAIFYEKDSRDNIEQNCGTWLDAFIADKISEGHTFYLCGDEMFLEAVLDGCGNLAPNSKTGWNLYTNMSSDDKGKTSEESGLRTDLVIQINRQHPESLVPSIPLTNVVMCIMHGLARSVERLLSLEVDHIISEANKAHEIGIDKSTFIDSKVSILESNINKRGVRQGNFSVMFDTNGRPSPIKLNKDHALTILAPSPDGFQEEFPHVLTNVCSNRIVGNTLPDAVKTKLKLEAQFMVSQLVTKIWEHFYLMYDIMRKDPPPMLKDCKKEGSLLSSDYTFGYSPKDKSDYLYHAECFYQLFKLRYGASNLTPYMMKFIDIAPLLMDSLPFSLGRLQNEGGEHANYLHNQFYFQHTTRHGGINRVDPCLALFNSIYKRISLTITKGDGSECSTKASKAFVEYVKLHVLDSKIPEGVKVRDIEKYVQNAHPSKTNDENKGIFHSCTFILCGAIPKLGGKSYSHNSFEALVKDASGKIKNKLPSVRTSTKQYIVLVNPTVASKKSLPTSVRLAFKAGYPILDFKFVLECLKEGRLVDKRDFEVDFTNSVLKSRSMRQPSLEKKNFRNIHVMTSIIKKRSTRKRKIIQPKPSTKIHNCNPALHFVWSQIRQQKSYKTKSRQETQALMSHFFQQWKMLSRDDRALYRSQHAKSASKQSGVGLNYTVKNPAYTNLKF